MKYKLISFTTCPFVQRAVIALKEKNTPFEIEFIDLANKPEWFLKISPRGKVPVLIADDTPIFESHAICEYLEETADGATLMPSDPVGRARDRAWFAYASEELLMPSYRMVYGDTQEKFEKSRDQIIQKVQRLESELKGEFLSEAKSFGMADIGMAPFLYRAVDWKQRGWCDVFEKSPKAAAWAQKVVARDSVQNSVPESFRADEKSGYQKNEPWIFKTKPY